MKKELTGLLCFFLSVSAYAQSDRGTITGTVADASGALIAGAQISLTNTGTGAKSSTVSTGTGNYTVPGLPVGNYTLVVEQPGFSKYEQTNVAVQVAVTTRIDVALTVGASTTTVSVTAEASALKTESAEQSMTVTGAQIANLPINFGIGAGAIRNPLSFIQMTPGATFSGWNSININGTSTFKILFEGQESTSQYQIQVSDELQPSVEAIEQFTLQTSNFSAEFGGIANGGLYNFTSKSGTNTYHGSAYDYFMNTVFNAGVPFTNDGHNRHVPVVKHLSDGGFAVGGPVWIPKLYDGRNKTFFFFNLEKYRDREIIIAGTSTVPNSAYLAGNLNNNLLVTTPANRNLGTDFAGRPIIQNAIYDPSTTVINAAGQRVLQPFAGNLIPQGRFDPVAVKLMATFPKPNQGDLFVNNFAQAGAFFKLQTIPSIKIDQVIGNNIKIAGYYSTQATDKSNGVDGLPVALSRVRLQYIRARTARVNYDHTLRPTLLLHVGVGFIRHVNPDTVPEPSSGFDSTTLGIVGAPGTGYPRIGSIGDSTLGGLATPIGPAQRLISIDGKLTGVASVSWVHGNHTYKLGGEWKLDTEVQNNFVGLSPAYGFASGTTGQPLYGQSLPSGTGIGSPWASFLLGLYDSVQVANTAAPNLRKPGYALYIQDTFKVSRKLTLDYGLRWDLQPPTHEEWRRYASFSPTVANPNANGILGGVIYEGSGAGRCNCTFAPTYPYAIGPRLGAAYQLDEKTVIRAGWGLSYGQLASTSPGSNPSSAGMGFNSVTIPSPGNGVEAGKLSQPLVFDPKALYGASYDPGLMVVPGQAVVASPNLADPNGGRPSRANQWNISLQREISKDIVVEAAFLGNHAVWISGGGGLINYNAINPAVFQKLGLDITRAADRTLLGSGITTPLAVAAGFKKPYANFPDSGTVLQSLRPFPQYSSVGQVWAPLASSWYDALQVKMTKRMSHGLTATVSYAYSKTLDSTTGVGNIYERQSFKSLSSLYIPHILAISVDYVIQPYGFVRSNKIAKMLLADWKIGSIATWQSGSLLGTPGSNNSIGSYLSTGYTRQVRVAGEPLFLKDPNCHCFDPTQETILNPKAWQDQAVGVPGSNIPFFNDFRGQRRPVISGGLGKSFRIKERASLSIRGEFFNIFNQMLSLPNPSTASPANPPTRQNGVLTGGFGFMNYTSITSNSVNSTLPTPRTGQIVARFEF